MLVRENRDDAGVVTVCVIFSEASFKIDRKTDPPKLKRLTTAKWPLHESAVLKPTSDNIISRWALEPSTPPDPTPPDPKHTHPPPNLGSTTIHGHREDDGKINAPFKDPTKASKHNDLLPIQGLSKCDFSKIDGPVRRWSREQVEKWFKDTRNGTVNRVNGEFGKAAIWSDLFRAPEKTYVLARVNIG